MTVRLTMLQMLRNLRVEIGMDPDVNLQANVIDTHRGIMQRVQRLLYDNEIWPHLRAKWTVEVPANALSIALPETLNPGAIKMVYAKDTEAAVSRPYRLNHGWDDEEFVAADPTEPGWPICRWQLEASTDFEVDEFTRTMTFWPNPDRDCEFYIYGDRAISPFTDDAHRSTLDSDLIVLQSAAEILAGKGSPDAPLKASAAEVRKTDLLKRQRGDVADVISTVRS